MKRVIWLVMLLLSTTTYVQADVLIQESFEYDLGEIDGADGGVGFDGEWFVESQFTMEVVELDEPMQYSVPGGGVINGGSTALRFGNDDDILLENEIAGLSRDFENIIEADEVYFSYLYRYDEDGFIDDNDFVVWWFNNDAGPQVGLKGNGGNGSVVDDIVGRVNNQFAPPQQAYVEESDISEEEGTIGTDMLIVARLAKVGLSDEPDDYDELSLWVNPAANDGDSPHAIAEATPDNILNVSLDSIGMRIFNQEPGDAMYWDALRLGETWDDVISPLGRPNTGGTEGDFDGDGVLGPADIDTLSQAVSDGVTDARFDLNGDSNVNDSDRVTWVAELKQIWFGDANMDGLFNSADIVSVFQQGHYEDDVDGNSGWAQGDWNGDGDFSSSDIVTAFQGGGYDAGPRAAASAVPEPSSLRLVLFGLLMIAPRNRSSRTLRIA